MPQPSFDPIQNWKRPKIVPRVRTTNELRELAVRLACKLFGKLLPYYLALAVPVYLLDCVLWSFFIKASPEYYGFGQAFFWNFKNVAIVWLTISLETLFVGSLATQYLGTWLFSGAEEIDRRRVLRPWLECWPQTIYYLLLTRVFHWAPFYPETILLERSSFAGKNRQTTRRRIRAISRGGVGGSAFSATLGTELYLLFGAVWGVVVLTMFARTLFKDPRPSFLLLDYALFPIFFFGVRLYTVAFNFCSYTNYRISCEGWDVDLAFKTELAKLGGALDLGRAANGRRARYQTSALGPLTMESEFLADSNPPTPNVAPRAASGEERKIDEPTTETKP